MDEQIPDAVALPASAKKSFQVGSSKELLGELEDWGWRAGAKEGECKISGIWLSKDDAKVKSGIWECTPGSFDVPERSNTETVLILSGRVRIAGIGNDAGMEEELGPGDALVLPMGCSVKWTVLEKTRKFFTLAP
mmetsp:Transcript_3948/g.6939  ORF Transcript_3948/g.6939 Transcript_3948/m.6939 type:complete len:135 (-) Transcript_3948:115-519(-)|eukprot:CAMPEP_0184524636 /NCGR_PEP_ID=MMETSP0198_2-20121128/9635_1 /TAXON_ID=1112570 /ORGANISM="Thraustochytrium sp., Strain LLF1b" /LENGTH=134 /DNA_ID=CAMNT_0026915971 /DNA_START=178 /DNA_END=582 /DNA_ORIENTATION=+